MSQIRKIAVAAGTFGVALSIGFVMQNGDAMASRFGSDAPDVTTSVLDMPMEAPPAAVTAAAQATAPSMAPPPTVPPLQLTVPEEFEGSGAPAAPVELSASEEEAAPPAALVEAQADMTETEDPAPEVEVAEGEPAEETAPALTADDLFQSVPDAFAALPEPAGDDCEVAMDAEVGVAAMVTLSLSAPCLPDAQVTMHHQGMIFTLVTDAEGKAEVSVPALAENAVFIAAFDGGSGAVATTRVPAIANYDRAVLQWQGDTGLQIHAREFGASYGTEGHVWNASARGPESAVTGEGGFLVRLGDSHAAAPLMAEVYTYPSAMSSHTGQVALSVEAEITPDNCGREVAAQSIQISPGHEDSALDLTLSMPDCTAIGDFLVLSNMLEDLTLAAR